MSLTDRDWADIEDLRRRGQSAGPLLAGAMRVRGAWERDGLAGLRDLPEATPAVRSPSGSALEATFRLVAELNALLLDCNPRGVLELSHGPGPSLGDEAEIASAIASALVPGVPDAVWSDLSGDYMFYNR